ncbi:hypothetical protein EXIGLDRAFT_571297, partial [Exidia glandulosa HHB12029]
WFTFGDSYTATSFNYTSTQPSAANPIGNPPFPGNTICGVVPNWLDYTIATYNTSVQFAYNFASAGATINSSLVPTYWPWIVPVVQQVDQFQQSYTTQAQWTSEDSIFSMWIGINDIGDSFGLNSSRTAFNDELLASYFTQVTRLYASGARKFVFFNIPPIDRSPLMVAEGVSDVVNPIVDDYNTKLAQLVSNWTTAHAGVRVWTVDTHDLLTKILDDPSSYGFEDGTTFRDGSGVVWCTSQYWATVLEVCL